MAQPRDRRIKKEYPKLNEKELVGFLEQAQSAVIECLHEQHRNVDHNGALMRQYEYSWAHTQKTIKEALEAQSQTPEGITLLTIGEAMRPLYASRPAKISKDDGTDFDLIQQINPLITKLYQIYGEIIKNRGADVSSPPGRA